MRIATYNVEWFSFLFDTDGTPFDDGEWSKRHDVTRAQQLAAVGRVFQEMDADAVMVIEAPHTSKRRSGTVAIEGFAERFRLRARKALSGFFNETRQEITLLYDPGRAVAEHDPKGRITGKDGAEGAPRFDGVLRYDLDIDAAPEKVVFSKPPLEVAFLPVDGPMLRLIGVHAKSKAPHGAVTLDEIMAVSIANRRKQLAQCVWIRRRVEEHMEGGEPVIVLGDFNDGPGLDEYEQLFGRSGVEIVLGEGDGVRMMEPHAKRALSRRLSAMPTTARFWISSEQRYLSALIDYVMLSPDLRAHHPRWRIWHPFDDPVCFQDPELSHALLTASDHFPVSVDLDWTVVGS
ncbi:endonuclease/exonuclease/phosphatase family protein [Aestuariibius sp. 2305UL40-4]|uniref:endonuclease/exonuclease/phosphatase family protein n=1 Tax=Aestuariibius violaceus TaxID=3234132 RepID=UPI00345E5BA0